MEDELTRAQHYRVRAAEMREASRQESDIKRRTELLERRGNMTGWRKS